MHKVEVFDPAMCCSTGVCGVDVDPVLAQFASDLKWAADHGVEVVRHNLGQEPQAFAANPLVLKAMEAGMDRLPVILVDGAVFSTGSYPARSELTAKLGIPLLGSPTRASGGCGCEPGTC
ncbi:MAG: arsenite efflux transporter metallochaperone ArsD [Gammaproteobacteria bacterium]|nr:arsenite efflux transporter metallochaperone ArsD [Gammaproteobacteria bacterium]